MLDVLLDALIDTAKLIPFLFITYLILEWIEHKAAKKTQAAAAKAGVLGPAVGGLLGAFRDAAFPLPPPICIRAASFRSAR